MSLKQTMTVFDLLEDSQVTGHAVVALFENFEGVTATTYPVKGDKGSTDIVRIDIPGTKGKKEQGDAPTLGIIGRLGGIGARPARIGMVSDADGAVAAIACALKLATMRQRGDCLAGDVVITTHICPFAPVRPHKPVDFMDSPVTTAEILPHEVIDECDAYLSIDTTKGNRYINHKGFAISPTVIDGYILHPADDLIELMEFVTGKKAVCFPLSTADITPYSNGLHHINSIMQPATATNKPLVGIAITTETSIPGCGTGVSHETDIAVVNSFCIEVAKAYGRNECSFYSEEQFEGLKKHYGSMSHLVRES
ncbi:DUF1177 domain-containing protein [Vibrio gazogenes]|uniref:DUF1177 domain-containing protein n=1 Tax=Vibrio gazogenes DSM 21264 = NBRC 103151 TaxID=1123492 RepID=A0A1M5DUB4_VIBGA|nr:DUF1177 domain-containing protein [Vibrio gazogenes]USP14876.1 DUF1177 domain-containing protein [Vibrio gazogenes]SHF70577.1 Protein of unknown function [Vibrio gazogenes DSM 21264] [Vibrio gazogenes DSM 21264 = NBRC 103151]SJN58877.1 hypothetical protein BQ6471_03224 [Vibrio gazogenes]